MFVPKFVQNGAFLYRSLGPPLKEEDFIMYRVGDTLLFFGRSTVTPQDAYDKEKIGLNHIALGVRTEKELQTIEAQLNGGAISHSGIRLWQDGVTRYIWLDDPDGMRVEFWLRTK